MNFIRNFFKKKVYLPLWFIILGRPVSYENFEEYDNTLKKIADVLLDGKDAIIKVNDIPTRVSLKDGKITMTKLDNYEVEL